MPGSGSPRSNRFAVPVRNVRDLIPEVVGDIDGGQIERCLDSIRPAHSDDRGANPGVSQGKLKGDRRQRDGVPLTDRIKLPDSLDQFRSSRTVHVTGVLVWAFA